MASSEQRKRPPRRSQHPETRPKVCEPGVPRAHGATCPTPPTPPTHLDDEPEELMCPITRAVFKTR